MKYEIELTDEQLELLQSHSTIIGDNYFMPYWFKRIDGNRLEMFKLGNLTAEMSAEIEEIRNQVKDNKSYGSLYQNGQKKY